MLGESFSEEAVMSIAWKVMCSVNLVAMVGASILFATAGTVGVYNLWLRLMANEPYNQHLLGVSASILLTAFAITMAVGCIKDFNRKFPDKNS